MSNELLKSVVPLRDVRVALASDQPTFPRPLSFLAKDQLNRAVRVTSTTSSGVAAVRVNFSERLAVASDGVLTDTNLYAHVQIPLNTHTHTHTQAGAFIYRTWKVV